MTPIYIPSRSRYDNLTLNCTLRQLPAALRVRVFLVVREEQAELYASRLEKEQWNIHSILTPPPESVKNLSC